MAELSFDIFAIACGNRAPAPVPAPEHGEREPELPEHPFTRHLKRPAEASPPVSPEKPRAAGLPPTRTSATSFESRYRRLPTHADHTHTGGMASLVPCVLSLGRWDSGRVQVRNGPRPRL